MELLVGPLQKAAGAEAAPFAFAEKRNVHARYVISLRDLGGAGGKHPLVAFAIRSGRTSNRRPGTGVKGTAICSLG